MNTAHTDTPVKGEETSMALVSHAPAPPSPSPSVGPVDWRARQETLRQEE